MYDGSLDEIKKKYKDKMKVDVKFEYTTDKIKLKDAKVLEQTEESASLILKHKDGNIF